MTAKACFEIEVSLSGHLVPFREATYDSPAEGGEVEDLDVEDIGIVEWVRRPDHSGRYVTLSILKGVDIRNPEVQKILQNLIDLKRQEFEEAIAEDA